MDADPEEWLEVKQRVLASHQQFGAPREKYVK
jgi:hypothetical protein